MDRLIDDFRIREFYYSEYVPGIPRIIHIIWIGPKVPPEVVGLVEECRALNPTFEVRLWRETDLQNLENQRWFNDEPKMSGKANIARYEILRDVGGIYIDADFSVFGSFEPILELGNRTGFVTARESKVVFNPAFAAAAPAHALSVKLVQGVPTSSVEFIAAGSPARTGPLYFTSQVLGHVRSGGEIAELPQHWVYPYLYDRPDLARTAISSETLMRHEWASIGGTWGAPRSQGGRVRRDSATAHFLAGLAKWSRPGAWKQQMSSAPMSHVMREVVSERLNRALNPGVDDASQNVRSTDHATNCGGPAIISSPLPAPLRLAVSRQIHRGIRGSATYVELGGANLDFWRLASRRLDRSGRAVSVKDQRSVDRDGVRLRSTPASRGSLALLAAASSDCASGNQIWTNGVPLRPRTLDRSRTLDGWDVEDQSWILPEIMESFPHIELLVISSDVDLQPMATQVQEMVLSGRIGSIISLVDPNSTTQPYEGWWNFLSALEICFSHVKTLGTIRKQGDQGWRLQLRAAQTPFGVLFREAAKEQTFRP